MPNRNRAAGAARAELVVLRKRVAELEATQMGGGAGKSAPSPDVHTLLTQGWADAEVQVAGLGEINRIAIELAAAPPDEETYALVCARLRRLTSALATSFSLIQADKGALELKHLDIDPAQPCEVRALMERTMAGLVMPVPPVAVEQIMGSFVQVLPDLATLTLGAVPLPLCEYVEQAAGIGEIVVMVYQDRGQFVGTSAIVARKGQPPLPLDLLATFAHVVSALLVRNRAEAALRESQALYRMVVTNAPVVLFALDLGGVITLFEGEAVSRFGFRAERVVGRSVFDIHFDKPQAHEHLRRALAGETFMVTIDIGRGVFDFWFAPARNAAGKRTGVIGVAMDVTARDRVQGALNQAQKLESIGLLAGGVAHDFNNLLTAILGQLSLAGRLLPRGSETQLRIARAEAAAQRAADLTRQLLAYAGKGQFQTRLVDLNQVARECSTLLEAALSREIELRFELGPDRLPVVADPGQLQQILMNLVINAGEAVAGTDACVRLVTRACTVDAAEDHGLYVSTAVPAPGTYVALDVIDNGSGMTPETVARIFDPFFTTKFTGRGLGLAAVLGIVRGLKGGLRVRSAVGKGTAFTVLLPAACEIADPVIFRPGFTGEPGRGTVSDLGQPPAPPLAWASTPARPAKVLVIDDEAPVREAVADILEMEGHPALVASDGLSGLALYEEHRSEIGLVLLDLLMPMMGGEETLHRLRSLDPAVKIALSSGYDEDEALRRLDAQHVADRPTIFLRKPYDIDTLAALVAEML